MNMEDYKRELLHIFFVQYRLIFSTAFWVFIASVLIYFYWPPTFGAYGDILVRGKSVVSSPESLERTSSRSLPVTKEDLYSEIQLLNSTDLLTITIKQLEKIYGSNEKVPKGFRKVSTLKSRMEIEVLPATNIIQIRLKGDDSKVLVKVLSTLMDLYMSYRYTIHRPGGVVDFLSRQADNFHQSMTSSESQLMELVDAERSADPVREIESNLLIKRDLEIELNRLKIQVIEKRASVEQMHMRLDGQKVPEVLKVDSPALSKLFERMVALRLERGKLLRNYIPSSKAVQQVENEIYEITKAIKDEVNAYQAQLVHHLNTVEKKIVSVEERIKKLDTRNLVLRKNLIQINRLERDVQLHQDSYETFAKRREEARINSTMDAASISTFATILNRAYPSNGPIFPLPIIMPLALVSGLLLGGTLGFSREFFDRTFKQPIDVERVVDLPVMFSLGDMVKPKKSKRLNKQRRIVQVSIPVVLLVIAVIVMRHYMPTQFESLSIQVTNEFSKMVRQITTKALAFDGLEVDPTKTRAAVNCRFESQCRRTYRVNGIDLDLQNDLLPLT